MTIEVARELQPTVITLDIASTSGEGWEILQELKTDEGTKDIPVIVCSILDERVKGLKNGADEYLLKPILEDDLVQAIEKFTNS
jgi:CheY-like chemotaxis protein